MEKICFFDMKFTSQGGHFCAFDDSVFNPDNKFFSGVLKSSEGHFMNSILTPKVFVSRIGDNLHQFAVVDEFGPIGQ